MTYRLRFHYPDDVAALLLERETAKKQKHAALVAPTRQGVSAEDWNFDYIFAGDPALVPKRVFDNGQFTYFEFADSTETPAIFLVNEDRSESLVNFHVQGRYVVVQRRGRQFSLRNGDSLACIFNERWTWGAATRRWGTE